MAEKKLTEVDVSTTIEEEDSFISIIGNTVRQIKLSNLVSIIKKKIGSSYQEKTDDTLTTTSKEVVGAINENASNICELKSDLSDDRNSISNDFDVTYQAIKNGYIETGKNVGEMVSTEVITNYDWVHFIIPVKAGYRFKVSGSSGYLSRQWCFVDNSYTVLSVSDGGISTESNIVASDEGFLICNFITSDSYSVKYTGYIGYAKVVENSIDALESNLADEFNLSEKIVLGGYIENQGDIGSVIGNTVTENSGWYYLQFPVKRGETYKVIGKGGYSARLWALTDNDSRLIKVAEPYIEGEYIISVYKDGYLTYNTQKVENIGVYRVGVMGFKELVKHDIKKSVSKFSWTDKPIEPYWVLSLDCAKKYFSIANIKSIIDLISSAGFNQLQMQLTTNKGFRFELDDMVVTDINGNSYDLKPCLGGDENPTGWYTISEMDEIITYSKSKGIDFYPFFELPAHMKRILDQFPQFRDPTATNTLDITNEDAVNFSVAILDRYAKFFVSRGCHFFNFGFDEQDFSMFYDNGNYNYVVNYGNLLIDTVKKNGLQPRMYNDAVMFNNDYKFQFDRDVEVMCWRTYGDEYAKNIASFNDIQKSNYKVLNSSSWFYYIDGSGSSIPVDVLKTTDVLKYFEGVNKYFEHLPSGAVLSVWCDQSVTTNPNDNGDKVLTDIRPLIDAFGSAIKTSLTLHGF